MQQTSVGLKAEAAQSGQIRQPFAEVEVTRVVDGGFGAQGAPFLVLLLDATVLVVDVQRRHDPVGQHARAEAAGGPLADTPLEDQLHLIGPAQVEVFADDLLKKDAAAVGPIET